MFHLPNFPYGKGGFDVSVEYFFFACSQKTGPLFTLTAFSPGLSLARVRLQAATMYFDTFILPAEPTRPVAEWSHLSRVYSSVGRR